MDDVEAHVAGTRDAEDRVEVRAVVIKESAGVVDFFLDHANLRFERGQRVGIGEHQRGDGVVKRRVEAAPDRLRRVGAGNWTTS